MFKKIYLFLIILVCLFAVSAVSGAEIGNDTNMVVNSDDSGLMAESVNEDVLTVSLSEEEIQGSADNGTFTALQKKIDGASEGSIISLENNYTYDLGFSTEGITINKKLTINGNGHTIDALGKSRIFYITTPTVTLNNITFKNGYSYRGGAIYFDGSVSDSTVSGKFINNTATYGGAIYFGSSVSDSNISGVFINNAAGFGGAIYFSDSVSDSNISGVFINNTDNAILFYDGIVSDSSVSGVFINNTAGWGGGAIFFYCSIVFDSNISGVFINNTAYLNGGAIYFQDSVSNSNISGKFINNTAVNGGAIYINKGSATIGGNFINNTGCAIYWNDAENGIIYNSTFISNELPSIIVRDYDKTCISYKNYFSPYYGNIEGIWKIIKNDSSLNLNNASFNYKNAPIINVFLHLENNMFVNNRSIQVDIKNGIFYKTFSILTNNEGIGILYDELNELDVGTWNVTILFDGDDNYVSCNTTATFTVLPLSSLLTIKDVNTTVGHETTLIANVISNSTVNEGTVTFFDGKNQIGESPLTNGKATITYTPTTAGEHTITAIFNSDNYLSSNDTSVLSVKKANIDLTIADIAPVLFTNPSNFAVNINSNYKAVNEGKIKYYVNNDLVGTVNVNDGVANLDYVTNTAGSFTLVAVYDETSNYLASNATATFIVNKMPTVLSAESVIFDEKGDKTFTTDLKDDNSIGVSGQNVKIETIKYSGESKTFNGITDTNGIAEYNVNNLEGGMWFVTGTYDGNGNYINSKFSDKFIVIRMDTTTNIEGIDNPQVNHTYKLKANIHDENGKLVKEGIVQFYLDGVDIGSIDLSKHELKSNNDLLGASNPIFDYNLGEDEEPYLEYTPTKAGTYTLSAVYEGTTIYRTSNETTTLIVKEEDSFILSAPDVTKYYGGPERFIVTLKDLNGNPIKNAVVKITINGRTSDRTTDDNGIASMGINLNSGVYITTTEYNGTKVNSTVTVKDTVIAKDFSKIFRNGTQYQGTFVDSQGNLIRNTDIEININGVFYTRKTNDNGVAQMNINLPPGTYILTATNPLSKEQHTTKVTVLPNIVENHDLTKYYKNASQYSLRLLDDKGNPVGAGVSVQLNINGVFYTKTSDANGYVKMNINLPPGTYIITAEYKGLRASNTIKVLSVLETKDLVMKYKDSSKFEAKVLDGQGKPYAGQTVTFNINGVFYTKTTEADGIARLKINLLAGEYIITSMYNGLNSANKVTISG